jgi:hypothetical protein
MASTLDDVLLGINGAAFCTARSVNMCIYHIDNTSIFFKKRFFKKFTEALDFAVAI